MTRRGCRTTCSSRRRSHSCAGSSKTWCDASASQSCDSWNRMKHFGTLRKDVTAQDGIMSKQEINLRRIDHVRFFVGNARQSAYFYRNAFGFNVVAYAGLETKVRNEAGYVLRQGEITFVL